MNVMIFFFFSVRIWIHSFESLSLVADPAFDEFCYFLIYLLSVFFLLF